MDGLALHFFTKSTMKETNFPDYSLTHLIDQAELAQLIDLLSLMGTHISNRTVAVQIVWLLLCTNSYPCRKAPKPFVFLAANLSFFKV